MTAFKNPLLRFMFTNFLPDRRQQFGNLTCFQIWSQIFTPKILEMITEQTNRRERNKPKYMSEEKMAQLLGIMLLLIYNSLVQK